MSDGQPTPLSPISHSPPARYRSRVPEVYGFVTWTSTFLLFCIYVLWALSPDELIVQLGIEWYPSREWALLLPSYCVTLVLLTYFTYFALAIYNTPPFSDINAFVDSKSLFPRSDMPNPYFASAQEESMFELYDIPLGMVNRVAYGAKQSAKAIESVEHVRQFPYTGLHLKTVFFAIHRMRRRALHPVAV